MKILCKNSCVFENKQFSFFFTHSKDLPKIILPEIQIQIVEDALNFCQSGVGGFRRPLLKHGVLNQFAKTFVEGRVEKCEVVEFQVLPKDELEHMTI